MATPAKKSTAPTKSKATAKPKATAPSTAPAKDAHVLKPVVLGPMMRKPELVNAVVAKSGMKKKDVKPIVEATLAVLGSALQDARELNLEPMGKIKVTREKERPKGRLLVARIRQTQDLPSEVAHPDPKDVDDAATAPAAAQ